MSTTAKRPWGVTLLAVLSFASVGTYLLSAALALAAPETLRTILAGLSPQGSGPAVLLEMGRGVAVYFAVMAVLGGLFGYGMWTLRNWARWVTIIVAGLSLLGTALGLIGLGTEITVSALLLGVLRIGMSVAVLVYLWAPKVRSVFQTQTASGRARLRRHRGAMPFGKINGLERK